MAKKTNKTEEKKSQSAHKTENIQDVKVNWLSRNNLFIYLMISLLSFAIYYRSIGYDYVLDDVMMIQQNKFTNEGFGGIIDHLTNESMTGHFGEQKNLLPGNRYRPLSLVTFSIEKGITGELSPSLGHFNNILLYALTGIFIFILFRQLFLIDNNIKFGNDDRMKFHLPVLIALVFIVHPLHVEAVANIKGRDEIMALLFCILSLFWYVKAVVQQQSKYLYYGAILYFLALLSKENAITWVVIIPLTLYIFHKEEYLKPVKSLLITTVIYMIWRSAVSGVPKLSDVSNDIMNNPFLGMSFIEKNATVLFTLLKYIQLLLIPYPLTHDYYPYAIPKMDLGNWEVWLSLLVYAALVWVGIKFLSRKSLFSYSILFYLITLSIVSNVVINIGTFMNDRFVYMPSLGYCLIAALVVYMVYRQVTEKFNPTIIYALGSILLIPYFYLSFMRVPAWENSLTLNKSAFPASENSARANSFMATAIFEQYRNDANLNTEAKLKLLEQARPYAVKSLEIIPDYHNANLMLAGIAGETYRYTRNLDVLLEDFYRIAMQRPDIELKRNPDGTLTSFITTYLSYLNTSVPGNESLKKFYIKLLTDMNRSNKPVLSTWKVPIAKVALQGFGGSPEISGLAGQIISSANQ